MTVVYRVVRRKYASNPLDVTGTRVNGGRWNPPGLGILYTAEHPALALVEILVHMPRVPYDELPDYRLFTLELPDNTCRILTAEQLPAYWNEAIYTRCQNSLADWLIEPDVSAVCVPSSVMPAGGNCLLHPAHPDYRLIRIVEEKALVIDPRLWP